MVAITQTLRHSAGRVIMAGKGSVFIFFDYTDLILISLIKLRLG